MMKQVLQNGRRAGFTLIELLIVTVVIVTLMGIMFRLAGVGGGNRAKATTLERLQRLENALSGYYAAYGSYPPVPLQGRSRSIYKKVDAYGRQEGGDNESGSTTITSMDILPQIEAACRAQPLSVSWPAPSDLEEFVSDLNTECQDKGVEAPYGGGFRVLSGAPSSPTAVDWRAQGKSGGDETQLFEFGLLSFLFPRYFFMLEASSETCYTAKKNGRLHNQWAANNQLPCKLDTGMPYSSWQDVRKDMGMGGSSAPGSTARREAGMISNLTSQAVCARWMPNFKGIVSTVALTRYRYFFGVDVVDGDQQYGQLPDQFTFTDTKGVMSGSGGSASARMWTKRLRVFPSGGYESGGSAIFLMSMTVRDGWGNELYYYSDPPYQSYRLWSAGENKVTFPPWYDIGTFSGNELTAIQQFIEDDIVHLTN